LRGDVSWRGEVDEPDEDRRRRVTAPSSHESLERWRLATGSRDGWTL